MPETLLIIANPQAGVSAGRPSRPRVLEAVRHDLERTGFVVEIELETDPSAVSDHAEAAVRRGIRRVVAAGGDGTVNAVVNGLMRTATGNPARVRNVTLGVLPLGTGNVFAFNLGIPRNWRSACKVIRDGQTRVVDVGVARAVGRSARAKTGTGRASGYDTKTKTQTRYFMLMAGIGFDAKVIEETSLRLKYVLRDFAYVLKTLQNVVLHQGTQLTLKFPDGHLYSNVAWLVMVGNAASYAWDIRVTSDARIDDGILDVCLMPFENKLVSIQQAMQILTGQHIERGIAQYWKVEQVRVESEPPVPVQLDGDEWSQTPVEFGLVPGALDVFAPPEV